jgi:hypothetical protein
MKCSFCRKEINDKDRYYQIQNWILDPMEVVDSNGNLEYISSCSFCPCFCSLKCLSRFIEDRKEESENGMD